jgi:D-apionolactonase
MPSLPLQVLYNGKDESLPERTALRAGPLSLVFENGDLRYVRLGDREVLRRVYVAVRDRNWNTIAARITSLQVEPAADSFRITFDCRNQEGEIDFAWRGTIVGQADGRLTYEMAGEARSSFWRNRIGICVLHPAACAGARYVVEHPDGSTERGTLPRAISPHQPAVDIQAFTHEVTPNVRAEVRFAGEVFEMEDQRNWTDASYKTYSTPLRLPYPVQVAAGTRITQSIALSLRGEVPTVPAEPAPLRFTIGNAPGRPLPRIGLGTASHGQPLSEREMGRLRALNLSHLRVDLNLSDASYPATLRRAAEEARALGVGLEAAIFLTDAAADELTALAQRVAEIAPPIATWLVFHANEPVTAERWGALARERLVGAAPGAKFGAGTNAYFTLLNRNRPNAAALDLVCYSINPQVHAFDNASLVETVATQATTVESARQFVGDTPIAITPITLKPRFNPDASGPEPSLAPGQLPAAVDVRQASLFGAGWTVGSLKYVAESGVASATYYETTGWRGVMETEAGSPLPEAFRSPPGAVFPLYHVLADVGELAGGEVIASTSSHPLDVDGMALTKDGRTRVILANLGPKPRRARVENLAPAVEIKRLDETNAERAMRAPEAFRAEPGEKARTDGGVLDLDLRPFAVIRIDF